MTVQAASPPPERSLSIAQARREWIDGESASDPQVPRIEPWLLRSWQRCLAAGHQPRERVSFDPVAAPAARRVAERNRSLVTAARPVLDRLSRAIADTRYFAI